MWLLYQFLYFLLAVLVGPWLLVRRGRHYLASLKPRLGRIPTAAEPTLWIHAVSVGEVSVASSLKPILSDERPRVLTTVTPSGQERARAEFAGEIVTYLPFELGFAVRAFFERLKPAALILCEGDLWPLLLREARRKRLPVLVVNARVSDKSFPRMKRLGRLTRPLFEPVSGFAVQTELDAERLRALGVAPERIEVTGNLKFEIGLPERLERLEGVIRSLAQGRPILIAGSTMRGEEEEVAEAFRRTGSGARALLVLAPRHPERWTGVAADLAKSGFTVLRRSELDLERLPEQIPDNERPDVLLLDSLGELAAIYGLARGVFVGGTLVSTGGHNPIEAACHGCAIAAGPSMENFREIEKHFDDRQAWSRVRNAAELAESWDSWIREPERATELGERARRVFEDNQGALAKTRAFLASHLGTGAVT